MVGCTNKSGRDKGVGYYRVPKVVTNQGKMMEELTTERRRQWISAISRDLWRTMPQCFQYSFGKKVTVIIDCFEVFIDHPTNLIARAQTFSNYKHHNTAKILIGITPQRTISFVSEAWGGRTSDKFLTENCGILKNLLPGDLVLADRGFTVHESVWFYMVLRLTYQLLQEEKISSIQLMLKLPEELQMFAFTLKE